MQENARVTMNGRYLVVLTYFHTLFTNMAIVFNIPGNVTTKSFKECDFAYMYLARSLMKQINVSIHKVAS